MYYTVELSYLSVDENKKQQGRNDVGAQRSMSMLCTFCQLFKLTVLTHLLDWKRCSKALSRHHFSVVSIRTIRTIQGLKSKFSCERLRSQYIQMFREEICSVVLLVHSTHRQTFLSYPLLCCKASNFDMFESAWSFAL